MDDREKDPRDELSSAGPRPAADVLVGEVIARRSGGPLPLAAFLGITALLLVSLGASLLVLAGVGRVATAVPEATPPSNVTVAPTRTAAGAATASAVRVRVVSASARSRPIGTGAQHEVTFTWVLEGAREGDPAVIQFYRGTQPLGQQRGTLDPSIFTFSTGMLTLAATLECSIPGWSAEILTVRGQPIEGDGEAKAQGVTCR